MIKNRNEGNLFLSLSFYIYIYIYIYQHLFIYMQFAMLPVKYCSRPWVDRPVIMS